VTKGSRRQNISGVCIFGFVFLLSVIGLSPFVLRPQIGLLCEFRMTDDCGAYVWQVTVENEGPFRKSCVRATSFVTKPTSSALGLNAGLRVEKRPSELTYEGESHENLKYVLSRNLLNTKGTQWRHFFCVVSYCHMSATLQTMSIIVETCKKMELWFEFLSHF